MPFDQEYELYPAVAVSVVVLPGQTAAAPVMAGVAGLALTVTVVAAETALQPLAFVTVTLYWPGLPTVIDWPVAPFDHRYEA